MSEDPQEPVNQRAYARFLAEMDVVLSEGGAPIDPAASAVDVSAAGFRVVTRAALKEGQAVDFELVIAGTTDRIKGSGKVVWAAQDAFSFDFYSAGIKITKMSWRDASKLRGSVYTPGYDFTALARMTFWALFWIIVVAGIENIAFHQPLARQVIWKLLPIFAALLVLAWSLFALLG